MREAVVETLELELVARLCVADDLVSVPADAPSHSLVPTSTATTIRSGTASPQHTRRGELRQFLRHRDRGRQPRHAHRHRSAAGRRGKRAARPRSACEFSRERRVEEVLGHVEPSGGAVIDCPLCRSRRSRRPRARTVPGVASLPIATTSSGALSRCATSIATGMRSGESAITTGSSVPVSSISRRAGCRHHVVREASQTESHGQRRVRDSQGVCTTRSGFVTARIRSHAVVK